MIPTAAVISGPGGCISLPSCIRSPGKHKGARVRSNGSDTIEGCARILHAIHVVNFSVGCRARCEPRLINAMHNVFGHGLGSRIKDRRLIHVVPETIYTAMQQVAIECAPPRASLLTGEVRKHAGARPDGNP